MEILFLDRVFHEKIWGGNRLKEYFHCDLNSESIGESWVIGAHPNGDCKIINGTYQGKTLSWLWENKKNIFGDVNGDRFPLLVKVIDARDDLSVQVHPDNYYAEKYENGEFGKTECWYIIDCDEGSELILGHNAKDKKEMEVMVEQGLWEDLLRKVSIKPGDFFYIPSGTIHAIGKGALILEIQQSSDITYRLYDYDRLENGKPRELHTNKAIGTTTIPYKNYQGTRRIEKFRNGYKEHLLSSEYFSVYRLYVYKEKTFKSNKKFRLVSILKGLGSIDGIDIKRGDNFILPYNYGPFTLKGELELIVSHL